MEFIETVDQLEDLYAPPLATSIQKVATHLTDEYRRWINASKFCALATVGPDGTDCSPRGDDGPVVKIYDKVTILLADWHGNNRIDSLRNIVSDGRVSLMFMVPGSNNVVRVNGAAKLTVDPEICGQFERKSKRPRSVIVIQIAEVYFQCARALMRSALWDSRAPDDDLPTAGEFLGAMTKGAVDRAEYDATWPERAKSSLW